jgi:hypothetical protein
VGGGVIMLAVFGIGQMELLIIGLICCFLFLPIVIAIVVVAVIVMSKKDS